MRKTGERGGYVLRERERSIILTISKTYHKVWIEN